MRIPSLILVLFLSFLAWVTGTRADEPIAVDDFEELPANRWTLIHTEDNSGGKKFSKAIFAENVGRLYLWGTGGKKLARNVYQRYELEAFDPEAQAWSPAFPESRQGQWTAEDYPPFRIYGQSGPDGLRWDEGPRLQVVGGYHSTNRIRWWDFDGVRRPSPIHTFNMACWDSKRERIVYYSDACTFALDPATNTWTDLQAENHPTTCRSLAWASMCYDPVNDEMLLFGGGLATNPSGAAPTWIYDCRKNRWRRLAADVQPPPRCNAPLVFEPATRQIVMFGGYNQAAALSDVWTYDCPTRRWKERTADYRPPPMEAPAAALLPGGRILVCGNDAAQVRRRHQASTSAQKQTWVYGVSANRWKSVAADLDLPGYEWLTATAWPKKNFALLVAFGRERRAYAFRYDAGGDHVDLPGAKQRLAWKYPEQKSSLENAEPPSPEAHAKFLASLPANEFVNANPPGLLISKTWSTAVIDTDRSEVIYHGGGHSGYSGNDFARYSIAQNRWSLDQPPCFPPYLEGTNAGIFGWSYGMRPFSQHTYLWYNYDPASKTVVYLARPSLRQGSEVQLTHDPHDVFIYDEDEHGYASWVYDSAAKEMRRPSFGRPFENTWHLSVLGTPRGVFATSRGRLYHAEVDRDSGDVDWRLVDAEFPEPREEIKYHYEFQPLLHDSKRDRLLLLKGDDSRVDVFARPLADEGQWQQLETTGSAAIGREAVYIPRHDAVLWLGDELYAFDCAKNHLAHVDVDLPPGRYGHECALVYDPQHDVCVALIPQSFSGPMQTFLFRYDPKTAEKE